MARLLVILAGLLAAALLAGFIYLGAAPPRLQPHEMHVLLPSDRLAQP